MANDTTLKERIRRGDIVIGVNVAMTSTKAQLEDILGKDDYSFIAVDSQHSPFAEHQLVELCATAAEVGIPVQFRIKHTRHAYLVGNLADLGPLGIEVPLVEEESVVVEALRWFYFPPMGRRSWIGGSSYGFSRGIDRLDYAQYWNNNGYLCMQIESLRAMENAKQLAKPGIDCLTWGPADLSFDMESNPNHALKTDDDCVRHVVKQLEGTDTKLSYRSYDPNLRNKYLDMGATVLMESPK